MKELSEVMCAASGITRPLVDLVVRAVTSLAANKRRRYDNVQHDKDRTFRRNYPQHRFFGPGRKQRWS
jgi:hypothetical protein